MEGGEEKYDQNMDQRKTYRAKLTLQMTREINAWKG